MPHFHAEAIRCGGGGATGGEGSSAAAACCPFFILACDGVWDALTDEQAVEAVLAQGRDRLPCGAAALRDLAFVHGSTDNISAMVVDLTQMTERV